MTFTFDSIYLTIYSVGKESTCDMGDTGDEGLVPGLGRFSGGGNDNPLQYSCLENPLTAPLNNCFRQMIYRHISFYCVPQKTRFLQVGFVVGKNKSDSIFYFNFCILLLLLQVNNAA